MHAVACQQIEAHQVAACLGDDSATVKLGRELIASINRRTAGDRERTEPAVWTQLCSTQRNPWVDADRKDLVGLFGKVDVQT